MDLPTRPFMPLESALKMASEALRIAEVHKVNVAIVVVDRAGMPLVQLRMPDAPLHALAIALDKAYTAISFGRDTRDWPAVLEKRSDAVRAGLSKQPHFVSMAGGVVLSAGAHRVAAIGVSGATEDIDEACARAGQEVFAGPS